MIELELKVDGVITSKITIVPKADSGNTHLVMLSNPATEVKEVKDLDPMAASRNLKVEIENLFKLVR